MYDGRVQPVYVGRSPGTKEILLIELVDAEVDPEVQ